MKKKIIGIFVCMLMITTCVIPVMGELSTFKKSSNDISLLPAGTTSLKFMIAGGAPRALRSYWLHVPPSYDGAEPVPLVIILHGSTSFNPDDPFAIFRSCWIENYTAFSEKSDEEGFIVVYPNAKLWYNVSFLPRGYYFDPEYFPYEEAKRIDDIRFISDLIDKMEQKYNINSSRIYATGISNGGAMSYSIGAYLSNTVAAIAPVAGTISMRFSRSEPMYSIPPPENPVSVIVFHGTKDQMAPYKGSWNSVSVNESVSFWVEHNGCDPTPEIHISESGKINRTSYTNGEKGTEVVLYTTIGGNHWWPGGSNPFPNSPWLTDTIQEISATDLIWEFFEAHPKQ